MIWQCQVKFNIDFDSTSFILDLSAKTIIEYVLMSSFMIVVNDKMELSLFVSGYDSLPSVAQIHSCHFSLSLILNPIIV